MSSAKTGKVAHPTGSESRQCGNKNCSKIGKHLCSGCGEEIYCSKDCQKAHWAIHKPICKQAVKPEAAAFLKSLDAMSSKQLKNIMRAKAATFEVKKRTIVLAQLDKIVEKSNLVKFVQEYVSPSEVESLLSAPAPTPPSSSSSSSNKKSGGRRGVGTSSGGNPNPHASRFANNNYATPSPDQLRQQASMMRKHPGMVRKSNPAFAKMSDAEIRQYADQLEQAANNPEMMKEVERMSRLSDGQRSQLQKIQEGLSGAVPMDDRWISDTIHALKQHPDMFKSMIQGKGGMLGGANDEQICGIIDMASRMDEWTLKLIIKIFIFIGSLYQPVMSIYNTIDKFTYGGGRYIALGVFAIFAYYGSVLLWTLLKWIAAQILVVYSLISSMVSGSGTAVDNAAHDFSAVGDVGGTAQKAIDEVNGVASSAAQGLESAMHSSDTTDDLSESTDAEFEF